MYVVLVVQCTPATFCFLLSAFCLYLPLSAFGFECHAVRATRARGLTRASYGRLPFALKPGIRALCPVSSVLWNFHPRKHKFREKTHGSSPSKYLAAEGMSVA